MGVQIKETLDVISVSKAKLCLSFLYEPLNLVTNTDKLKSNRALELDVNGGRLGRVGIVDSNILHASCVPAAPIGNIVALNTLEGQI